MLIFDVVELLTTCDIFYVIEPRNIRCHKMLSGH